MKAFLISTLALGTMTSLAMAEPVTLADPQLDGITAGRRDTAITDQGQGNLSNENVKKNPGTVTETTSGPPGQIKNEKFNCNNCETATTGPGNK